MARRRFRIRRLRGRNSRFVLTAVAAGLVLAYVAGHSHASAGTAGGGRVGHVAVTSGSEATFFRGVLADLNAPANHANIGSLEAWYPHEYPSWPPGAANNPLDSTLPAAGVTAFNTFDGDLHVWNYPDASVGAQMTAQTLATGYPRITSALRSGAGLCGNPSIAGELSTWSGGGYSGVC